MGFDKIEVPMTVSRGRGHVAKSEEAVNIQSKLALPNFLENEKA